MSSKSGIQCKYFASGACSRGEACHFVHSWNATPNTICKFFLQGTCSYGSRCRYDHIRPSNTDASSGGRPGSASQRPQPPRSNHTTPATAVASSSGRGAWRAMTVQPPPPPQPAPSQQLIRSWGGGSGAGAGRWGDQGGGGGEYQPSSWRTDQMDVEGAAGGGEGSTRFGGEAALYPGSGVRGEGAVYPPGGGVERGRMEEEVAMCSLAAKGHCPRGQHCKFIHGDVCPRCGKECLHPYNSQLREEHERKCGAEEERRLQEERRAETSHSVECGVCLEKVTSKEKLSSRRFGILPNCAHAFCLECIRSWRDNERTGQENTTARACPFCRTLSYFVVPSTYWVETPEEKELLIKEYHSKMGEIPCKHFNYGEGTCPFGTSCFYAHKYRDGRAQSPPNRRKIVNADGELHVSNPSRLVFGWDDPVSLGGPGAQL